MKIFYAFLALIFAIFWIDLGITYAQDWSKRRKRQREIARFNMGSFKAVSRNWWEA